MQSTAPNLMPLISVIVPTYNYGHFINQSLDSLISQTYQNWECIVVDDGSTDNTAEVVQKYVEKDPRISYIRQENSRQGVARNNGIQHSNGQFYQFLDADDLIEAEKFKRQIEYLEDHPEIDILYGDSRFFNSDNPSERFYRLGAENKWEPGISGQGKEILRSLVTKDTIPINTAIVRRSVIEKVGLFDGVLSPVEDWDYWIRCAAAGMRFQYQEFPDTHALVRFHPSSASRNSRGMLKVILLMRKKIRTMQFEPDILRLNKRLAAEEEGFLGVEEVLHGSRMKGATQLLKAAIVDQNIRHKMKWVVCALIAPVVSKLQFKNLYSSSLSQSAAAILRR